MARMNEELGFVNGLLARSEGPMSARLLLQPAMAAFFAFRDGRRDVRDGRPPYLWSLFGRTAQRRELLKGGWQSIGKVFVVAVLLDLVFQRLVFHDFRPAGALITGLTLAIVPYLLLRGLVNRLSRRPAEGTQA